ncbi:MAG: cell division protein FtsA [Geminicoccaceae bacterium]|nr:cell division protein FtsA [Geminicoccaceae bacterium]
MSGIGTLAAEMGWRQIMGATRRTQRSGLQAVLDVGTSKLCCYIVQSQPARGFALLGRGYQAAEGVRAGNVVDVDEAVRAVMAVVHEAELEAKAQLREVTVTWSGGDPRSHLVTVERDLAGRELNDDDLATMLEIARAEGDDETRVAAHVLPIEMRLDDGRVLRDARGLSARSVELLCVVTTVDRMKMTDLRACLDDCHLEVAALVPSSYAAGMACLTREEMDRGCLVLEMGGGTTGIAHFHGGRMVYLDQIAIGGDHVSRDIAYGLSTSGAYAERLKNLYGSVQWRSCDDNTRIEVPLIGDHVERPSGEFPRTRLTLIVRSRVEEILEEVQSRLRSAWDLFERRPPRSVVLTGGGAQIEGMVELVEELFGLPTRIGAPTLVSGRLGAEDQPCCSAAGGALAVVTGDDGGLLWRRQGESAALTQQFARVNKWWRQNFTS